MITKIKDTIAEKQAKVAKKLLSSKAKSAAKITDIASKGSKFDPFNQIMEQISDQATSGSYFLKTDLPKNRTKPTMDKLAKKGYIILQEYQRNTLQTLPQIYILWCGSNKFCKMQGYPPPYTNSIRGKLILNYIRLNLKKSGEFFYWANPKDKELRVKDKSKKMDPKFPYLKFNENALEWIGAYASFLK